MTARPLGSRGNGPRLGVDGATPFLALGLWWPADGRVARADARVDRRAAAEIVARVDAFLANHGVTADDLTGIGVGVGPGSYTGARVAVAWASGMARALGIPLVGGDTLAARAAAWLAPDADGEVAVEARRGEAWVQAWHRPRVGAPDPVGPRRIERVDALSFDARASLACAPDAAVHAQRVGRSDAEPPRVRYPPTASP